MMITTPLVALFTDWSEVRHLPLLIVAGSITLLSSILVVDRQVDRIIGCFEADRALGAVSLAFADVPECGHAYIAHA